MKLNSIKPLTFLIFLTSCGNAYMPETARELAQNGAKRMREKRLL